MQLLLIEERKKEGLLGLVINFRPSLPLSNAPPFNSREEGVKICIGGMLPLKTLLLFFPLSPLLPPFSAPKKERERGVRSFPCQHMGAPKKKRGGGDGREFLPFLQIRGNFRARFSLSPPAKIEKKSRYFFFWRRQKMREIESSWRRRRAPLLPKSAIGQGFL